MQFKARTIEEQNRRFQLYTQLGFDVIHNDRVDINPGNGNPIEVDFSATDTDFLIKVAIQKAFEAGVSAGKQTHQKQLRDLLGISETPTMF